MTTRITIEVSNSQKQQIKILAALKKVTIKDLILERTIGLEEKQEDSTKTESGDIQDKKDLESGRNFGKFWKNIK